MNNSKINPSNSFVAIDIEYADKAQNICQFGLVVVKNLEITERRSWLIQPPNNYYDEFQMRTHHITPADTANAQTFPELWPEIQPYTLLGEMWAHNAVSVEQPIIEKNLRMYGFNADYLSIHDSRNLYERPDCQPNKGNGLAQCCMALDIPCENHHNAEYDADRCAELVIRYIKGQKPNWNGVPTSEEELRKSQQEKLILHLGKFQEHRNKQKEGSDLNDNGKRPDLFAELKSTNEGAGLQIVDVFDKGDQLPKDGQYQIDFAHLDMSEGNPLRGKVVAMTGFFDVNRAEIERALKAMGATTDGMTGKTDILLVGTKNVSLEKLSKYEKQTAKGRTIALVVGNIDLKALLYGDGHKFFCNTNSGQ